MIPKGIVFADGENLVFRFQELKKTGRQVRPDVVHIPDCLVWSPEITKWTCMDITRVLYYTSLVGDDVLLQRIKDQISDVGYDFYYHPGDEIQPGNQQIVPMVFKKDGKSQKSRHVDINITIDIMRHAHSEDINFVYILSGDGDYLPLIQEVMRAGKQVFLSAFTSGLHPKLKSSVDLFTALDGHFFL